MTYKTFPVFSFACIAAIALIAATAGVIYMRRLKRDEESYKMELRIANFRIQQGEQQAELLKSRMEDIRIIRHDISHHYRVLLGLCETGNYEKMAQYLRALDLTDVTDALPIYTRNHVANIFISYYKTLSEKQGITFSCQADLPEELPCNSSHLGILLGNAFQNAAEAAGRAAPGRRRIETLLKYADHKLILTMQNTFHGSLHPYRNGYLTTKPSGGHGIGLRSIRHIVTYYDGYMQVQDQDHLFTLKVILHLPG